MNETDVRFLETALERQWITRRQRDKLLAEGSAEGGESVADRLIQLGYLTHEQAAELKAWLANGDQGGAMESAAGGAGAPETVSVSLSAAGMPGGGGVPASAPLSLPKTMLELSRNAGLPLLEAQSRLNRVLIEVHARGTDDFHWFSDGSSSIRLRGNLFPWDGSALALADLKKELPGILSARQQHVLEEGKPVGMTVCLSEGLLARLMLLVTAGGISMAARLFPAECPPLDMLGLPPSLRTLLGYTGGLILIAGPKNSGRTTTVHALAAELMRSRRIHCLRILQSLDYFLPPGTGMVTTWRVGREIPSLLEGLRQSPRVAPDVLLIDELISGPECLAALDIAENNRLVLAVVGAETAQQSYSRFVEATGADAIASVAQHFSEQLRGLLAQRLVPRADAPGRIVVGDYLIGTPQSATTLRSGRPAQVPGAILSGKRIGMIALDDALMDLVQRGVIAKETALQFVTSKQVLDKLQPRGDSLGPSSASVASSPLAAPSASPPGHAAAYPPSSVRKAIPREESGRESNAGG